MSKLQIMLDTNRIHLPPLELNTVTEFRHAVLHTHKEWRFLMNLTSTTYRPPCPKMAEVASSLLLSSLIRTETKDAALPRLSSYIIPPIGQHVSIWMEKYLSKRYSSSANEICSSASKQCGSRCDLQRILCSLFAFLQLEFFLSGRPF